MRDPKIQDEIQMEPFYIKIRLRLTSQEVLPEILHLSYLGQKRSISGFNRK